MMDKKNHPAAGVPLDAEEITNHTRLLDVEADSFIFASFDDDKARSKETARIREEVRGGRLPKSALDGRLLPEHRHGTVAEAFEWMEERQRQGAGVFLTVQAMEGERRAKDQLAGIRAVYAELDHGMPQKLPLEPSFVVESSLARFHPYWLIDPEYPLQPSDHAGIMMRLIESYGSDPDAKDLARVLRLAGTWNMKPGRPPRMAKVVHESGYRYSRDDLLVAFPPPELKRAAAPHVGARPNFNAQTAPGLERFLAPLDVIPPDNYGDWIRVGQALHHESGGGDGGLKMWDAWSATSEKAWITISTPFL